MAGFTGGSWRRLAMAAMLCVAGQAGAAMPGLYFSGFYMDSTLAFSTADVKQAELETARGQVWNDYGFTTATPTETDFDRSDIGYAFSVGYQLTQYFAGEFSYMQLGDVSYEALGNVTDTANGGDYLSLTSTKMRARGLGLSGIGIWPLGDHFSLDARAGLLYGKSKLKYTVQLASGDYDVGSLKGDSIALLFGAGINWAMSPGTAIRAGYTRLEDALYTDTSVAAWTLSLKYAW